MNNINIDEFKKAAKHGKVDDFVNKNLSPQAASKLKQILSDKDATQKLLSTPEAKSLMKKIMEKEQNGQLK